MLAFLRKFFSISFLGFLFIVVSNCGIKGKPLPPQINPTNPPRASGASADKTLTPAPEKK